MWDYTAFPVWAMSAASGDQVRGIEAGLRSDLQDWSDRVTDAMWGPDGPSAPGWDGPGDAVIERFDEQGRALAARLQDVIGPETAVEYEPIRGAP
jgi:hypothetical protein